MVRVFEVMCGDVKEGSPIVRRVAGRGLISCQEVEIVLWGPKT